jgi:CheY-like chemotaxis protein
MTRLLVHIILQLITASQGIVLLAQGRDTADSLDQRLQFITQLVQSGSYEKAQVESEGFRAYLRYCKMPITPKAARIISGVYYQNKDKVSGVRWLSEAEAAANGAKGEDRMALWEVLAGEYQRWEMDAYAQRAHEQLITVRLSLSDERRNQQIRDLQSRIDSLVGLRAQQNSSRPDTIEVPREQGYALAAIVALFVLSLLYYQYRTARYWHKELDRKELEWELIRANLQQKAEEKAVTDAVAAAAAAVTGQGERSKAIAGATPNSVSTPLNDPFRGAFPGEKPNQLALIIEPNRQIILYLKSLLSDRFQVETAYTPNEGLQMATSLLPDIIVCDALLNGTTGVEVVRKIKLSDRTNHIPVVLLTDKFGNEGKLDALRAGADAWFFRPVLDDDFTGSVRKLLDAHKLKHEHFNRFLQLYFTDARIPQENPFLAQTLQWIEQNLSDPDFMADDIARKMQMTNAHYSKKLKVLTGKEPVQLIRELRLEKAKVLLERRAGTPQAISNLVGFSNPGTFAMAFKDYFGENTSLLYSLPPRLGSG